jgi:molybdopterin-dependent oxidoreductase alpha subunit
VTDGLHLCTTRLRLLRLNTMPAFDEGAVADIARLRAMDNAELQALGRVPYPFLYRRGDRGFARISWEQALDLAGRALADTPGPRQAWFATSRGITNEAYYTFTKAARLAGTNNVDLCARLCHQASVAGLKGTIGVGAPTCSLSDMIGTDLLLLWGTNLANNQPVTMKYLAYAKEQGTRIVVINPVREKGLERYWVPSLPLSALFGTKLADDFLQVRPGGDIALVLGVLKALDAEARIDLPFVQAHTTGWEAVQAQVRALDWDRIVALSGCSREQVEWLATLVGRARTMVSVWSMGLTQHEFGTADVEAMVNLHLARGMFGREKTGVIPIRGHSGVQGGAECGVGPGILPGGIACDEAGRERFSQSWGHPLPTDRGLTTVPMVKAMGRGEIDFLYNLGSNLLRVLPDPGSVRGALDRVKVRIHQDIVFNTSTVAEGDLVLVLPAQTRYEQRGGGTSTSTERRVRFSPEIPGHPQVGECRPEYEIPAQVVARAFPGRAAGLAYADAADIRREMGVTMPLYAGIGGLAKAGDWIQWGGPRLFGDGIFATADGRGRFTVVEPVEIEVPEGAFYLATRRGKQFNSIVLSEVDAVHGSRARDELLVNRCDLDALGLSDGDRARLFNQVGSMAVTVRVADIRPGLLQGYWPELNVLIPTRLDPRSEEPDYHAVAWLERA